MQSIVSTSFASGSGTNAATALAFLSPTVEVTTMLGQRVLVTATQTIGHSNAFGATGLDVFVCYMRAQLGLVLNTVGIGLTGLAVAPYTRMPVTLSQTLRPVRARSRSDSVERRRTGRDGIRPPGDT